MKKFNLILILSSLFLLIFSITFFAGAEKNQEELNLTIDIEPYATLEVLDDINIRIDKPWSGGEIKEVRSTLILKSNTEVQLSWKSTEFIDPESGRTLPVGILEKGNELTRNEEHPGFGITADLQEKGIKANKQRKDMNSVSSVKGTTLHSSQSFAYNPGVTEFDIIMKYYWSADHSWSDIRAGKYSGSIVYTVAAVEE